MRRSFFRRPAVAWTVAGILAAAAVATDGILWMERSEVASDLAAAQRSARPLAARFDALQDRGTELGKENRRIDEVMDRCVEGLNERVDQYNVIVKEQNQLQFVSPGQASGFISRMARIRQATEAALARCRP